MRPGEAASELAAISAVAPTADGVVAASRRRRLHDLLPIGGCSGSPPACSSSAPAMPAPLALPGPAATLPGLSATAGSSGWSGEPLPLAALPEDRKRRNRRLSGSCCSWPSPTSLLAPASPFLLPAIPLLLPPLTPFLPLSPFSSPVPSSLLSQNGLASEPWRFVPALAPSSGGDQEDEASESEWKDSEGSGDERGASSRPAAANASAARWYAWHDGHSQSPAGTPARPTQ
mmetsp:Transcript_80228/g.259826  ORF Transcript_80228/g.259826 Transcript_80228/m.259826 type:complete len:231 (-) Transcript_80228:467-1159(-)